MYIVHTFTEVAICASHGLAGLAQLSTIVVGAVHRPTHISVNASVYVVATLFEVHAVHSRIFVYKVFIVSLYLYSVAVGFAEYQTIVGRYVKSLVSYIGLWIRFRAVKVGTVHVYHAPAERVAENLQTFS